MTNSTYNAATTVHVDDDTAEFIAEAEKWAKEAEKKMDEIRKAKADQSLFELGATDFLCHNPPNAGLHENSDAYFQGYDYGRRLTTEINEEAKKRFPLPSENPNVGRYVKALIKKNVEIKK